MNIPQIRMPEIPTGIGPYAHGKGVKDDQSIQEADTADLAVSFVRVMEAMHRTGNLSSLADLANRAGDLWYEMVGRGVEFK